MANRVIVTESDRLIMRDLRADVRGRQRLHPAPQRRPRRVGRAAAAEQTSVSFQFAIVTKKIMGARGLLEEDWGSGEVQLYDAAGAEDGDPIELVNRSADEVNVGVPVRVSPFGDDKVELMWPYCYPLPNV